MRGLLAYGQLVVQLARKHGGLRWVAYNSQFQQQANAGASAPWFELNLSLMAATVFAACQLCFAMDHTASDCALALLKSHKTHTHPPALGHAAQRMRPHQNQEEVCR